MEADEIEDSVAAIRDEVVEGNVHQHIPPGSLEEMWDADGLTLSLEADFGVRADVGRWIREDSTLTSDAIVERCIEEVDKAYIKKVGGIGSELMRGVEKQVMLRQLDLPLEGASGGDGSLSSGGWSAFLRAEESEAGI